MLNIFPVNALAVFCAKQLVFIELLIGGALLYWFLPLRSHLFRRRWLVASLAMVALSLVLMVITGALVRSPRPFVVDGLAPLIPHAPNNGFPSHHALMAAAIAASVSLVESWLILPMGLMALLVDWGRVACHVHHVSDVLGSTLIVVSSLLLAIQAARQVHLSEPEVAPAPKGWREGGRWTRRSPAQEDAI